MRCKRWYIWQVACLTGSGMLQSLLSQESSQLFPCLVSHYTKPVAQEPVV